jgi:hypothetical protein
VVATSTVAVLATAAPALAHGIGGRRDLPVPEWLFVFGAASALLVSFVALSTLWREPRFEHRRQEPARPSAMQSLLSNGTLEWAIRLLALVLFLVVAAASSMRAGVRDTIGPIVVFSWFWVGVAFASAVLGNVWATISPFDTIGRLLALDDDEERRPYPASWGLWPAAIQLFLFVWVELVDPFGGFLGSLGILIVAYTLVQIAGMQLFGRQTWLGQAEAFSVYFGLIARVAPLARDDDGRVVARPPLAGLASVPLRPGLLAVVTVALGSTTFDGFSRSQWWITWTAGVGGIGRPVVFTAAMLCIVILVAAAYAAAMVAAARVVRGEWHPLAVRFAPSLIPIVLAYVVAHYFSFLLLEGQLGLIRLSDPFAQGWDLFGTAGWEMNLSLVSPTTIWYVQVAAIVIGHVGGVIAAHDRAIASFPPEEAVRTQYALLAVMVLFTVTGLLILSG